MSAKTVLLNRKLENLRTQYQNNIKSMDEMRSEYEKSLTDRLAAMQNEMQNKLSEHDEVLRTEYEKYLEEYSAALNKELNKKIDDISAGYAKLKEENDLMYARMKEIEKEISGELKSMNLRMDSREQTMREEARRRMEKLYDEFQRFSSGYPHEFFEPSAADALLMQMESVKADFKSGFYESCMASSSGIGFQIALFEERMKKNLEQWVRYFTQLENYTLLVNDFLGSDDFSVVKCDSFEKRLSAESELEAERFDFWSGGRYSQMLKKAGEYADFTARVSSMPGDTREEKITSFLKRERKSGNAVDFEVLSSKIDEVTALHKEAAAMRVNIHTGFISSFERAADLSVKITAWISDERCGLITEKGFRDNDIRNEYTIKAEEAGKKITVEIFPVCPDNMTVVNAVGIYFEHNGSGTAENLKATEENFLSGIRRFTEGRILVSESNCSAETSDNDKVMALIRNRANEKRRKELTVRKTV